MTQAQDEVSTHRVKPETHNYLAIRKSAFFILFKTTNGTANNSQDTSEYLLALRWREIDPINPRPILAANAPGRMKIASSLSTQDKSDFSTDRNKER